MDICHYMFIQTHRVSPDIKCVNCAPTGVSLLGHETATKAALWCQVSVVGRELGVTHDSFLYFPFNFTVNLSYS